MKPTISLVLIVRNEAHNIGPLLRELALLCDEAIVVDTGSTDDTVALARAQGATVIHFPWGDDFAAARNFGIDAAGCHWILTVDADERLAASDFQVLRKAISDGQPKGYFFIQRNYTNLTSHPEWRSVNREYPQQEKGRQGYIEAHQIRLFPNEPELRYQGCIHETLKGCNKTEHLSATIHHFGHMQTGEAATRRGDLYSRLTREKLRRNPDDGDALFQMATRHLEEGRPDLAQPMFEKLVGQGKAEHPATARGNLALGRIFQQAQQYAEAIEKFELAVQQKPEWLNCWTETLAALVEAGRWSDVAQYLNGSQQLFPNEPLLWRFECRLMIATGQYAAAADKAGNLVEKYPNWQGAQRLALLCRELVEKHDESSSLPEID